MREIEQQNGEREKKRRAGGELAAEEQQENSQRELAETEAPDERGGNFPGRHRAFRALPLIGFRIKRVIQERAAGVQQTGAEARLGLLQAPP